MKRILLSCLMGCMLIGQSAHASNHAYLNMHKISIFGIIADGCKLFGGAILSMAAVTAFAGENGEKKVEAAIAGGILAAAGLYCASLTDKKETKKVLFEDPQFPLGVAVGAVFAVPSVLFPEYCNQPNA